MGKILLGLLAIVVIGAAVTVGYPYLFAREIVGTLESVETALPGGTIVTNSSTAAFSAGVMVREADGSYVTFSTEDRQWATLRDKRGLCVRAKIFPYGWWNISRAGTWYNGRLLDVSDTCPTP
jgi:hypothetical protein